jgi:hypothetical protein
LLMLATVVSEEVHVTEELMSLTDPSLKVPVAVNCWVVFVTLIVGFFGEISIEASREVITLTVVEALIPWELALMVAEPSAIAVARPLLLMKTTAAFEVVHVGEDNTLVPPPWNVAVAWNCCSLPTSRDGDAGVIESEDISRSQK